MILKSTSTTFAVLFTLMLIIAPSYSQNYSVHPNDVNPAYDINQDSHEIILNSSVENNKLLLWMGGTGSDPTQYPALMNFAASLGYHVINLSYENETAAYSLTNNTDPLAFNNYRQEICFGTPVSSVVTVDSLNSILTRATSLVEYLNTQYPLENWGQFVSSPGQLAWDKITTAGHSQGSGHACYLAKHISIERVAMFSGPNDYSTLFSASGGWISTPGVTPINNHYAYLSINDEIVDFQEQFENLNSLQLLSLGDSILVDINSSPYNNSHFLYTSQAPGISLFHHNSPVKYSTINLEVWEYMLTDPIIAGMENSSTLNFKVYPNPASDHVTIESDLNDTNLRIYSITGAQVHSEFLTKKKSIIDIAPLPSGVYFVQVLEDSKLINTERLIIK